MKTTVTVKRVIAAATINLKVRVQYVGFRGRFGIIVIILCLGPDCLQTLFVLMDVCGCVWDISGPIVYFHLLVSVKEKKNTEEITATIADQHKKN